MSTSPESKHTFSGITAFTLKVIQKSFWFYAGIIALIVGKYFFILENLNFKNEHEKQALPLVISWLITLFCQLLVILNAAYVHKNEDASLKRIISVAFSKIPRLAGVYIFFIAVLFVIADHALVFFFILMGAKSLLGPSYGELVGFIVIAAIMSYFLASLSFVLPIVLIGSDSSPFHKSDSLAKRFFRIIYPFTFLRLLAVTFLLGTQLIDSTSIPASRLSTIRVSSAIIGDCIWIFWSVFLTVLYVESNKTTSYNQQ